ncbi:MAG TPA: outer membrane beta-barrel protein, partial [Polyangiaceae bacterium]|nr:outer membrane beta-barrel protein [Polyangiaceae bacterium]
YRFVPRLALEAGLDWMKSRDQQGDARNEAALLLNALVFFNPRDVVQVYGLAGLGFSGANVSIAPRSGEAFFKPYSRSYSYFGGQLGLGVEVRVSRRVAIASDLIGFLRGRTDERWDDGPEPAANLGYQDGNARGGALLRAGVTLYW